MTRKYAMTRLGAGDYLLPGNDGTTLWRIYSYEDGPEMGAMDIKQGTFWAAGKFARPFTDNTPITDDFLAWDNWPTLVSGQRTRADVIEAVLS